MLSPYLIVFNPDEGDRQALLNFLDTRTEIKNWYAFLPSAVFVISDRNANSISDILRTRYPGRFLFVTPVVGVQTDGWLPQAAWDFVNQPKSSGRWP